MVDGPVRAATGRLRRLHRVGSLAVVHRGLHPRRRAPAVRQHPHRVVRHRTADDPVPRRRTSDHRRLCRRHRRTRRAVLRQRLDRCDRQDGRRARSPDPVRARGRATTCPSQIPADQRPVVFIGPYEHHSNELPWRESIADVVTIDEDHDGHVDLAQLEAELERYRDRPQLIGSFSAASNVTGIVTDTIAVSSLLHRYGAIALWDYAAAAPYVEIDMGSPAGERRLPRRDLHLAAQADRRPRHTWPARRPPRAVHQPRSGRAGRRHGGIRQSERARLPLRRRTSRGGRHARHRRIDPGRPRLPAQAGRRARRRSAPGKTVSCARRSTCGMPTRT